VKSAPEVLGWVYKGTDEPWKTDVVRLRLDRLQAQRLVRLVERFRPDFTICTHFMPTGIVAHLMQQGAIRTNLSIAVTDLDMHAMWLCRTFHRFFVAIDETKVHLEMLGIPPERVTVSGIPIDPEFAVPVDVAAARARHGLDPARPTLLFSAGAFGVSPAALVCARLKNIAQRPQVVVVCGRNEEARANVMEVVGSHPDFRVYGFTDRMRELMGMADLFIGKPGGLTTAEVLACGLPMAIISPIPGQEERNSDHLLEEGVAIKCNEVTTLHYKIERLLGDPDRLAAMRRNAARIGRPGAAREVAETLLGDEGSAVEIGPEARERIAQLASGEVAE
jgi:processive 1,2-diacylglycerol beta-glucosyltransferase